MRSWHYLLLTLMLHLAGTGLLAAFPSAMNYQGRLTDNTNNPITTTTTLTFTFWDSPVGGTQLGSGYSDAPDVLPNVHGLYSTTIGGAGNPIPASIFDADFVYLNVNVATEDLAPRLRVTASGYAFRAASADTAVLANDSSQLGGVTASAYASGLARSPVALGFILGDGTLLSGSGVSSATWTGAEYEIAIAGETVTPEFVTVVTPSASAAVPVSARISPAGNGNLSVQFLDETLVSQQRDFHFVTYKVSPSSGSYAVSGTVLDGSTSAPVSGVTLSFALQGSTSITFPSVVTDINGNYNQSGLYGSVVVVPSKPGSAFTPAQTVVSGSATGVDFVVVDQDSDGDGVPNSTDCEPFDPLKYTLCNGVCVDLNTDPDHCSTCNNACSYPNAAGNCVSGICSMGACDLGYSDCNGDTNDGCEVYVAGDPSNCGSCGSVCILPNATASCVSGNCAVASCDAGYSDCNGNASDGCEVNINTSNTNCGACNISCPTGQSCVNGACQ